MSSPETSTKRNGKKKSKKTTATISTKSHITPFTFDPDCLEGAFDKKKGTDEKGSAFEYWNGSLTYLYPDGAKRPFALRFRDGTHISRLLIKEAVRKVEDDSGTKKTFLIPNGEVAACVVFDPSKTQPVPRSTLYPGDDSDELVTPEEIVQAIVGKGGFFERFYARCAELIISDCKIKGKTVEDIIGNLSSRPGHRRDRDKNDIPDSPLQIYIPRKNYSFLKNKRDFESITHIEGSVKTRTGTDLKWADLANYEISGDMYVEFSSLHVKMGAVSWSAKGKLNDLFVGEIREVESESTLRAKEIAAEYNDDETRQNADRILKSLEMKKRESLEKSKQKPEKLPERDVEPVEDVPENAPASPKEDLSDLLNS